MTTTQGPGRSAEPAGQAQTPGSELSPAATEADTRDDMAPLTGKVAAPPADARQLEQEIERTREQLGQTVQELAAKADVKSRAEAKVTEIRGRLKATTAQLRGNAAARTKNVRAEVAGKTGEAREHWMPLAIAAGLLAIGIAAFTQWKRRV